MFFFYASIGSKIISKGGVGEECCNPRLCCVEQTNSELEKFASLSKFSDYS